VELETYAWDALPDGAREGTALVDGIVREIRWCAARMESAAAAAGRSDA
jgi:hypothetical protein